MRQLLRAHHEVPPRVAPTIRHGCSRHDTDQCKHGNGTGRSCMQSNPRCRPAHARQRLNFSCRLQQSEPEGGWRQLEAGPAHRPLPCESLKPIAGLLRITQPASLVSALPVSAQGDVGFRSQVEVRCIHRHILHWNGNWQKKCPGTRRRASPMSQLAHCSGAKASSIPPDEYPASPPPLEPSYTSEAVP